MARKATALASRARTEDALLRTEASLRAERSLLTAQLTNQKALLAATEDLLQKNTRLFEAGAFDVLDVIASQQAVARDRQALVDFEGQLQQVALRVAAARALGVFDAGAGAGSSSGVGLEAVR